MRLGKYLAHAGVASRRGAETIIRAGRVSIDGVVTVDPAVDVGGYEAVAFDGRLLSGPEAHVVHVLNKPAGVVSTASDPQGRRTVIQLIDTGAVRVYPVGRLDVDTTGLILLTNDGELANLLMHPRYEVEKTYRATVAGGPVGGRAIRALREGVVLEDGPTAPAGVRVLGANQLELVIHEGRKRQIRRMCEAVGHRVIALERVAYGPLELGSLKVGEHRRLAEADVERLRAAAAPPS
ncbi:MAG TPA: pseudouridine synthase [Solirubrobacteraceae bacterium]|nr:pseudouridine synthase [Solirubrobacteraceae bacterium]